MKRHAFGALFGLTVVGLAAACSDEVIVLASIEDEEDAGPGNNPHHTYEKCTKNEDCHDEFCQFDRLDPPSGHCSHRPIFCGDEPVHPVCGDDGITYLNDCYRKQAGRSSKTEGECEGASALFCDARTPCPIGATCELLGGGSPSDIPHCGKQGGQCWGLIDRPCDDDPYGLRWNECSDAVGALRCVNTCKAIQTGRAFAKAYDCD